MSIGPGVSPEHAPKTKQTKALKQNKINLKRQLHRIKQVNSHIPEISKDIWAKQRPMEATPAIMDSLRQKGSIVN